MRFDPQSLRAAAHVADGAWFTELQARGLGPGVPVVELANLAYPLKVVELAYKYLEAGAEFLSTNTFSANRLVLRQRGITASVEEINSAAVRIAREVAGPRDVPVLGVLGPSGKILAVREVGEQELAEVFVEQARVLAAGGADALLLETFSEIAELVLAVKAVKEATGLPVIACMSFDSGPQYTRTIMGTPAGAAAEALEQVGADVIGCNCGAGIAWALPAVVALRAATARPVWCKPSAGLPDLEEGHAVYSFPVEDFVSDIGELLDAGANVVGGCCGAGPEHIRRVAALVERRNRRRRV